jgi:myosin I
VDDGSITQNLRDRLVADCIYTRIGHVLVAVNPYKWLPIYDGETMRSYIGKNRMDVVPHVFEVAESAFRTMVSDEEDQCVIISGESGAGPLPHETLPC